MTPAKWKKLGREYQRAIWANRVGIGLVVLGVLVVIIAVLY